MKKFTKITSCVIAILLLFSVTACKKTNNANSTNTTCTHSYTSEITKKPTCQEPGAKTFTCDVCKDSYTEEIEKLTTHSYTSEITKEATCQDSGVKTYTCDICGDSYTEDIEKTDHDYVVEKVRPASCAIEGINAYTCEDCGYAYTEEVPKFLKHEYQCEVTKEATCKELGVKTYICDICGDSYTEAIAKATHSYTSSVTKEATCDETGVRTYTCGVCGDSYTEDIAKNENHSLTRNGNCKKCGFNLVVELNMSEAEKNNASKLATVFSYNTLLTDNSGNYIVRFALSSRSEELDASALFAVPALIDITITNSNGLTVYSKTREVKSSDYQIEDGVLCANVKINVEELKEKDGKLSKLYYTVYIPSYIAFPETELSVPAIIIMPDLPDIIYEYDYSGKLKTGVKITDISYTIGTNGYFYLYFTGEKTYDQKGDLYSRGCSIGFKVYDEEDYLIVSDKYTTQGLMVGEKFRDDDDYVTTKLEPGGIYRLELLNVG